MGGLRPHSCYRISFIGRRPGVWLRRLQSWKMSHQVSSLFHVETWKTLNLSDFKFSDGFKFCGKNVFKASVLIFCKADLIPLLEKKVCASVLSQCCPHCLCLRVFFEGSEESRWPTPRCRHKRVVFLFTDLYFFNYSSTAKRASEFTLVECGPKEGRSGTTLSLVSLSQVLTVRSRCKPLMTAQWLAAGLNFCVSSSTSSSLFSPSAWLWEICSLWFSGSCEMMAFCLGEEGRVKRDLSSLIVFMTWTQLAPRDSLIKRLHSESECPLCVTSHIVTL